MPASIHKQCVRFNEPGHAHELTFSCYRRLPLLARDRTRVWLAEAIAAARARQQFELWAYVFMPEHVHPLVYPRRRDYQISSILWSIKQPVARQALGHLAKHSPDWLARLTVTGRANRVERRFWQAGGGYDRNLMEPTTIRHVIDYIHGNPIRRGLVNQADDWPWSSAGFYSGRQPVKLDIDTTLTTALGV